MKRRHMAATVVAMTTVVMLTGCGAGGSSATGTADDPVELTFYMDKAGWQDSFDAVNAVSKEDGRTLEVVSPPSNDAGVYDSFVKQSLQTKKKPDLFTWHTGGQLEELVQQGAVAETTDIWERAEADGLVPEGLKANYTVDGKQYCVPLNVVYWVVYYNKHVFADHAIEVPETYDDLMQAAGTLKEAGVTPFFQMNFIFEFAMYQALMSGADPKAYADLGDASGSFTDAASLVAADEWSRLIDEGYFNDPGVQTDPQTLLSTGEVAMEYLGTFMTGQLDTVGQVSGEDYGIFLFPSMDPDSGKQLVLETGPLCVASGAANEEAALAYSEWWLSDEAQQTWVDARGDISFNPNVTVDDPELQKLVDQLPNSTIQQRFQELVPLPVYNRSTEVFGEFVTNGGDLTDGLKSLQDDAAAYWDERD